MFTLYRAAGATRSTDFPYTLAGLREAIDEAVVLAFEGGRPALVQIASSTGTTTIRSYDPAKGWESWT
jgi:hypothetical protein